MDVKQHSKYLISSHNIHNKNAENVGLNYQFKMALCRCKTQTCQAVWLSKEVIQILNY